MYSRCCLYRFNSIFIGLKKADLLDFAVYTSINKIHLLSKSYLFYINTEICLALDLAEFTCNLLFFSLKCQFEVRNIILKYDEYFLLNGVKQL